MVESSTRQPLADGQPPRVKRLVQVGLAFVLGSAMAALIVYSQLPSPADDSSVFGFLGSIFVMTAIGPILFAWAWGPGPMGLIATSCAFLIPALSLGFLYFGFFKRGLLRWLAIAALIWGGFGGFAAFVAITGSI